MFLDDHILQILCPCHCFIMMWRVKNLGRKGILDSKKVPVMDVIDFAAMSDTDDLPIASPGAGQTKSGRASFKNELTKRYGSKYRDPDNCELLMGEHMPLGKAFGILAICMFGPNLPTEKHRHADRLQVWKNGPMADFPSFPTFRFPTKPKHKP
jgi:hypothetical protein